MILTMNETNGLGRSPLFVFRRLLIVSAASASARLDNGAGISLKEIVEIKFLRLLPRLKDNEAIAYGCVDSIVHLSLVPL